MAFRQNRNAPGRVELYELLILMSKRNSSAQFNLHFKEQWLNITIISIESFPIKFRANYILSCLGSFFLPRDQQSNNPAKSTDYEGLAYLGEYPLAWSACCANESVYNLLLDNGADPDAQDSFGNMILHMVVVCDKLVGIDILKTFLINLNLKNKFELCILRICLAMRCVILNYQQKME